MDLGTGAGGATEHLCHGDFYCRVIAAVCHLSVLKRFELSFTPSHRALMYVFQPILRVLPHAGSCSR